MEDVLQRVSNDHKTLYYSSQLKVIDVTQNLRSMGLKLNINELKIATSQTFNNFCMLQKIFEESNLTHLFHLIKSINQNYNSIITILLERTNKKGQNLEINCHSIKKQHFVDNVIDVLPNPQNLLRDIKKNKLGGIHLFNQNYTRYLEDQRILQQIKSQKQKRLHRNKMDLLRDSIFEELNHKTDVEQTPAKNDEITNYILRSKDKNSIFNYVSYESELQQILHFFQNSQNQANDFLIRKVGKVNENQDKFSFSDFQRDIQFRNMTIKKNISDKVRQFLERYRLKEKQIETYISQKQLIFQRLQEKYFKKQDQNIQTDLNFDQFLKNHERQLKDVQLRCHALQNIKRQQIQNDQKENQLLQQLALRENHIQKQNSKINQLQNVIQYIKKLLREQKSKKPYSTKEFVPQRSQKIIVQIPKQEKSMQKQREGSEIQQMNLETLSNSTSTHHLRKTSYISSTWLRKHSNDVSSYMSISDLQKIGREHQYFNKEKKKQVRYNIQNNLTDPGKISERKDNQLKVRKVQSNQFSVQTENKLQDTLERLNLKKIQEQKEPLSTPEDEIDIKSNKSNKSINNKKKQSLRNSPKRSSKKLEGSLQKKSKKKSMNNIIQSKQQQQSAASLEVLKKMNKGSLKVPIKQQKKIEKLNFNQQSLNEEQKNASSTKNVEKKDQLEYKIFEVVEEDGQQQRQTMKNSERSEKLNSVSSHKRLQFDLYQRLSKQLSKIKKQKEYSFNHLYDLTVFPKVGVNDKKDNAIRLVSQQKEEYQDKVKNTKKMWGLFEDNIKQQIKFDAKKKQKMVNWKKKMINHINSQIINEKQAEQILSILNSSPNQAKYSSIHQSLNSPTASASRNLRKSMPDITKQLDIKPTVKDTKMFKNNKLKTSSDESQRFAQEKKQNHTLPPQIQQKLDYIIKYQAFHSNFRQKFVVLHKKCKQGSLCSHINKYFETIMRQSQQRKKKQKQSIILPVEHIGNETELEANLNKEYTLPYKRSLQNTTSLGKDIKNHKQTNFNRTKNRNAPKLRYSQELTLPSIKETKLFHNNLRT